VLADFVWAWLTVLFGAAALAAVFGLIYLGLSIDPRFGYPLIALVVSLMVAAGITV
jgi:hypothetical protein